MDSMTKNAYLFVAALAAIVIVLLFTQRPDIKSSEPGAALNEQLDERGRALPSTRDPQERAKELLASEFTPSVQGTVIDLSSLDAPKEINARALKLSKSDGGTFNLLFSLYSERRCMEGDYDIISTEMAHNPEGRLLLTLEPLLDDARMKPFVWELSVPRIQSGLRLTIPVPSQAEPLHLALFICSDSEGAESCKHKKKEDLNQIMPRYIRPGAKPSVPEDKVYFFQYFLLEHNSLTAFKNELDVSNYDKLLSYLSRRLGSVNQANTIADTVRTLNQTIRSASATFDRNRIRLNLPSSDGGKCEEMGITIPEGMNFGPLR